MTTTATGALRAALQDVFGTLESNPDDEARERVFLAAGFDRLGRPGPAASEDDGDRPQGHLGSPIGPVSDGRTGGKRKGRAPRRSGVALRDGGRVLAPWRGKQWPGEVVQVYLDNSLATAVAACAPTVSALDAFWPAENNDGTVDLEAFARLEDNQSDGSQTPQGLAIMSTVDRCPFRCDVRFESDDTVAKGVNAAALGHTSPEHHYLTFSTAALHQAFVQGHESLARIQLTHSEDEEFAQLWEDIAELTEVAVQTHEARADIIELEESQRVALSTEAGDLRGILVHEAVVGVLRLRGEETAIALQRFIRAYESAILRRRLEEALVAQLEHTRAEQRRRQRDTVDEEEADTSLSGGSIASTSKAHDQRPPGTEDRASLHPAPHHSSPAPAPLPVLPVLEQNRLVLDSFLHANDPGLSCAGSMVESMSLDGSPRAAADHATHRQPTTTSTRPTISSRGAPRGRRATSAQSHGATPRKSSPSHVNHAYERSSTRPTSPTLSTGRQMHSGTPLRRPAMEKPPFRLPSPRPEMAPASQLTRPQLSNRVGTPTRRASPRVGARSQQVAERVRRGLGMSTPAAEPAEPEPINQQPRRVTYSAPQLVVTPAPTPSTTDSPGHGRAPSSEASGGAAQAAQPKRRSSNTRASSASISSLGRRSMSSASDMAFAQPLPNPAPQTTHSARPTLGKGTAQSGRPKPLPEEARTVLARCPSNVSVISNPQYDYVQSRYQRSSSFCPTSLDSYLRSSSFRGTQAVVVVGGRSSSPAIRPKS